MSSSQQMTALCHGCGHTWYAEPSNSTCSPTCPQPDCRSEFIEYNPPNAEARGTDEPSPDQIVPHPGQSLQSPFLLPFPFPGAFPGLPQHPPRNSVTTYNVVSGPRFTVSAAVVHPQGLTNFAHTETDARLPSRSDRETPDPLAPLFQIMSQLFGASNEPQRPIQPSRDATMPAQLQPMMGLLSEIFPSMNDYVFSDHQLDEAIFHLSGDADRQRSAPPADPDTIAALPRETVSVSMLDENGQAECTICMDSVTVGTEVTALYCHHWFHHECIKTWLDEHNTCPHCRMSIEDARNVFERRQAPAVHEDMSDNHDESSSMESSGRIERRTTGESGHSPERGSSDARRRSSTSTRLRAWLGR